MFDDSVKFTIHYNTIPYKQKEYYNIFIFDISDVSLQNVQRLNFSMAINFPSVLFLSFADFTIVVICLRMAK